MGFAPLRAARGPENLKTAGWARHPDVLSGVHSTINFCKEVDLPVRRVRDRKHVARDEGHENGQYDARDRKPDWES